MASRRVARTPRDRACRVGSSTVAAPRATLSSAWMPAPCDSGATAIEHVVLGRARDQVGQVVGDDEGHLAVRQHRRPWAGRWCPTCRRTTAGRPRRPWPPTASAPAVRPRPASASPISPRRGWPIGDHVRSAGDALAHGVHVRVEAVVDQHRHGAAGGAEVRDLGRRQPEVDRHPDGTQAERDPAALEHRQRVARLHEQPVAACGCRSARSAGDQRVDARGRSRATSSCCSPWIRPGRSGKQRRGLAQQRATG